MTRRRRRRIRVVLEAHASAAPARVHAPGPPAEADASDRPTPGPEGTPGSLVPRPGEVDWLGTAEALLVNSTPLARTGFRLAVNAAWWSPLWLGRRWSSLRRLDPEARAACIAAMGEHRLHLVRDASFLLKIVAGAALLGPPALRARSRYDVVPPAAAPAPAEAEAEAKVPVPPRTRKVSG